MVKIRLAKLGRKKDVFYRVIAIDEANKNIGKALATLGYWYPKKDLKEINKDEIKKWVAKGAQLSAAVKTLVEGK